MANIKKIHSKCYAVNIKGFGQYDSASDTLYFPSLKQAKAYIAAR